MRIIKTLTCAIAATVALTISASSAKAAPVTIVGQTTDFMKVNFTASLVTNAPSKTTGNETNYTTVYKTGTSAINNKTLIAFFASWSTNDTSGWTNAGAQLIYDWQTEELCVADKSGTNILFYAQDGIDSGSLYAYVDFYPESDEGAYNETQSEAKNGDRTDSGSETYYAYFHLHFEDGTDADYVDFVAHGINTEKFTDKFPASSIATWTGSDSLSATGWGELKNNTATVTSLKVTMSGKGTIVP